MQSLTTKYGARGHRSMRFAKVVLSFCMTIKLVEPSAFRITVASESVGRCRSALLPFASNTKPSWHILSPVFCPAIPQGAASACARRIRALLANVRTRIHRSVQSCFLTHTTQLTSGTLTADAAPTLEILALLDGVREIVLWE